MADENKPETETPAEPQEAPQTDVQEEGNEAPKVDSLSDLPEWAQKEVKSLRAESANYRTKFREAENQLKEAKNPEEFEEARRTYVNQIEKLQTDLTRTRLASQHNLPDEVAELLTGTPEEMEAKAKSLSKHLAPSDPAPGSLKGGLTPDDEDDEFDPKAAAAAYRKARYRF